jgi:predicted DCC family thiol-disulfide oxidoreductase YuxK
MTVAEARGENRQLDTLLAQTAMLYDGTCVFCNGAAKFALQHEQEPLLMFAPLQSEPGRALSEHFGLPTEDFKTFVIVTGGRAFTRYAAAVQLGYLLGGRWAKLARVLDVLVPDVIGNPIYRVLWPMRAVFGRKDQCILPTPQQRLRQLDGAEIIASSPATGRRRALTRAALHVSPSRRADSNR